MSCVSAIGTRISLETCLIDIGERARAQVFSREFSVVISANGGSEEKGRKRDPKTKDRHAPILPEFRPSMRTHIHTRVHAVTITIDALVNSCGIQEGLKLC